MKIRSGKGKSIIDFPDKYVCIDIETTGLDFEYDEIIEISAALVDAGNITTTFSSLVKPKQSHALLTLSYIESLGYHDFTELPRGFMEEFFASHLIPSSISVLTGINDKDVINAPPVEQILSKFLNIVSDNIIVGHNVNFDINFIYDICETNGYTFDNNFIDTLRISRKLYPQIAHHRLTDVANFLNFSTEHSHRAFDDVITTVGCYERMKADALASYSLKDFQRLFKHKSKPSSLSGIVPTVDEVDDTNPIYGKVVVFTGTLSNMTRREAFQAVVNLGGIPSNSITKKTNFLVVGNDEYLQALKEGQTNKMKKAAQYKADGIEIETLSENTFFEMLQ